MSANINDAAPTKVYTDGNGHAVIEQPNNSIALTSSEQILAVIKELHVCYDYCAAWKEVTPDHGAAHADGDT